MFKRAIVGLLAGLLWAIVGNAQAVAPVTVGAVNCGRTTLSTMYCYSVPVSVAGVPTTAWFDVQGQGGFILFRPGGEGPNYYTAAITGVTVNARNAVGLPTSVTLTFHVTADPDNNNDADSVVGTVTLTAAYTYNPGRYGGYVMSITGGSGAQSIAQD